MTHDVIVLLAVLGVVGQVIAGAMIVIGVLALFRVRGPLRWLRNVLWGYELWAAFLVAAIATGGSLFLSQVAGFIPCEMCWFQRICMYPLSILTLFAAVHGDNRFARYLLPFPIVGACLSIYHLLIENQVIAEPSACKIGGAGCAVKWINYFGYMTIPTLTLTAFVLLIGFLALAAAEGDDSAEPAGTLAADGQR
ncbi:MAG TPA: disulfide bond formation protein B [Gaiellaceae bacterium]|nr:disulfide bond formation protein B [Gaiellaceae bacterium]